MKKGTKVKQSTITNTSVVTSVILGVFIFGSVSALVASVIISVKKNKIADSKYTCSKLREKEAVKNIGERIKDEEYEALLKKETDNVKKKIQDYRKNNNVIQKQELIQNIEKRKKQLIQTINDSEKINREFLLTKDEIQQIENISTNCVETETKKEGELNVTYIENLDTKDIKEEFSLVTNSNERFILHADKSIGSL